MMFQEGAYMANVVRYDPFDLLEGMMKSVLRPGYGMAFEMAGEGGAGTIPIDMAEDDRCYYVWAELPGVIKEDVTLNINGNQLWLSAEVKREKAIEQGQGRETLIRNERRYGTISRTLNFAIEIDDSKAEAKYRDGVLALTLPKKESAHAKRLAIH